MPPASRLATDPGTALEALEAAGLTRRRRLVEASAGGARERVDGRDAVNFCSNDYLGLAREPRLAEAFARAARELGTGSGASHLVSGHHPAHHALEEVLADYTGRERALLFSTGYMANLGLACAVAGRGDTVLEDRLNHASLLDAGLLSGARFSRFPHADVPALARRLARSTGGRRLVLTDGVFSMDGDIAPLPAMAATGARHGALLAVDDAHGLGVLGPSGGGTLEHFGLGAAEVPLLVGTLGKAFGSFGAFVAGGRDWIELLLQRARTYIYTTALPPAVAVATRAAVEMSRAEPWRRERLHALVRRFRERATAAGLPLTASSTPIQPLLLGEPAAAVAASEALLERGFLVAAIRPPTVPRGGSRLRVTLSAIHDEGDVDRLVDALAEVLAPGACPEATPSPAGGPHAR
jgi:8-amino-7-oxononanoate synthase